LPWPHNPQKAFVVIGTTLSHYRIVAPLGAGGMGEVYRAEDTRLHREVAIKVLPPTTADDQTALARLEREARAVAALSHPNIVAVFELGKDRGVTFVVTELLVGDTLRATLKREPVLLSSRAEDIAGHIAAGLAASHAAGIVHRDLKPENIILLQDGGLKILDFGLAAVIGTGPIAVPVSDTAPTVSALTRPGSVLGTVAYMAPEQLRGEVCGPAADVFAFGVVLHEMLTGLHPFQRGSYAETASSVLRDEPPRLPATVPSTLAQLVIACLAKDAAARPATAGEIVRLLSGESKSPPAASGSEASVESLAVLPFANIGSDPDTEYLSDGIADTLIDALCVLPGLRVMAASTVSRYRGRDFDPQVFGNELGVRAVLTGSLRQRGEELLIGVELVDTGDGRRLWGARYRRPLADLLSIELEIAREITTSLSMRLSGEDQARLMRGHTASPEAHEAYLQGRYVWNRWKTPEGMQTAIGFFSRALELDPLYARAYAGLADSYSVLGNVKHLAPEEAFPKAKAAAERGRSIDPGLAELHTSLGFIHRFWEWDWTAAEAAFQKAIETSPSYATAHRWYALLLSGLGRHDEAIARATKARELDPNSVVLRTSVGDTYFYARRYEESMTCYREAIAMDEGSLAGHTDLARSLELAGRWDEAVAEYKRGAAIASEGPPEPSSGLAHVFAGMGRRDEALDIVRQLLAMRERKYISPYGIASIHACLGEIDESLTWLERAYSEHDQTLVWLKVHPRLEPLRGHPRFQALLGRLNLA
jgi:serine/threonine protein kinase/tetratricopeptide (TPR) repeat protein